MEEDVRTLVSEVLAAFLDGKMVSLDERLLVDNLHDARLLLHEASLLIAEYASQLPAGIGAPISFLADSLHRVSCEKTAQEEAQTWRSESPFLN